MQGRDMLAQFDFGCAAGDHTNHTRYVTLDVPSEAAARQIGGVLLAGTVQVVEVGKLTEEQICCC